jgi:hypothetical protein
VSSNLIFSYYNKCFFCNSTTLGSDVSYNYKDNPYTKKIREENSLNLKDMQSNLRLKECNSCNALTFEKWFNPKISKQFYLNSKHKMGWYKFFNTIYNYNSEIIRKDLDLFFKLSNEVKNIESYMELFCPFNGLIPLFSIIKNENQNEKFFESKIARLKIFIYKIIKKKKTEINLFNLLKNTTIPFKKTYFLEINTDLGWNKKCLFGGCSCVEMVSKFDWVKNTNIADFKKIDQKIDILFLSNVLDHINEPLNTLVSLAPQIKNMFIEYHDHIEGGSQHSFFLTKKTIEVISNRCNFFIKKKFSDKQYLLSYKKI